MLQAVACTCVRASLCAPTCWNHINTHASCVFVCLCERVHQQSTQNVHHVCECVYTRTCTRACVHAGQQDRIPGCCTHTVLWQSRRAFLFARPARQHMRCYVLHFFISLAVKCVAAPLIFICLPSICGVCRMLTSDIHPVHSQRLGCTVPYIIPCPVNLPSGCSHLGYPPIFRRLSCELL